MMNPMQIMGLMNQLRGNSNPMQMLQGMYGNNPRFSQVMQMTQGKSPEQLKQIFMQTVQQRGIPMAQVNQLLGQLGIRL